MRVSWTPGWFSGVTAALHHAGRLPEFAHLGHGGAHGSSRRWKGKRQFLLHPCFSSQLRWCKLRANLLKIVGQGLFKFVRCKHTLSSLEFLIGDKSEDLTSCGHCYSHVFTIIPQFSRENYGQTLLSCPDLEPARRSQHPAPWVGAGGFPPVPGRKAERWKPPRFEVPWVESSRGDFCTTFEEREQTDSDFHYQIYLGKRTTRRGTERRNSARSARCAAFACGSARVWVSEF